MNLAAGDARTSPGRLQERALRRAVWRGEARAPPILTNRAAREHTSSVISLDQHHTNVALRAHVAVRARVKRLTAAVKREHTRRSAEKRRVRHKLEADARCEATLEVVALQSEGARVGSDERR